MRIWISFLAFAAVASFPVLAQAPAVPKDVTSFAERAEGCVHFGGEVPENPRTRAEKQRAAQVAAKIKELCRGNKRRVTALKTKYAGNKPAIEKIIEAEKLLDDSGALE